MEKIIALVVMLVFMAASLAVASPGQKYYWIETDLDGGTVDKTEQWNVWSDSYEWYSDDFMEPNSPHNLRWWTDEQGVDEMIENNGWQINTKLLVWAETSSGSLILYVEIYGQSNQYPEFIKWTVTNDGQPNAHFIVDITSEDVSDPHTWISDPIRPGEDSIFKEIGTLDNLWLSLYFYDGMGG